MDKNTGLANIKVIGVGGGGNNAVNRMIDAGIKSCEFLAVNTDKQALTLSLSDNTLIIGKEETQGLGAGADPSVGEKAALSSRDELREHLRGVDLLFITAGMGGGTGTGAAPIIANIANELGILTVAVVTKPFDFEGKRRMLNAERGVENLRKFVDTLVVIPNQKLLEVLPADTTMVDAFIHADDVLRKAVQGISDMIVMPAMINLDFADVRSIMRKRGLAHMGIGEAEGPDRMLKAVRQAVMSPLLETNIGGSSGIILNIIGGPSMTLTEVANASKKVQEAVDDGANIIFGAGIDSSFGDKVQITLIATGFGGVEDNYEPKNNNDYIIPNTKTNSISNEEFSRMFVIDELKKGYIEPSQEINHNANDQDRNNPNYRPQPNQNNKSTENYPSNNFGFNNLNNNHNNDGGNFGNAFGYNHNNSPKQSNNNYGMNNNFGGNNNFGNQDYDPNHQDGKQDTPDRDSNIPAFLRRLMNKK